jgi:hypothetical protein
LISDRDSVAIGPAVPIVRRPRLYDAKLGIDENLLERPLPILGIELGERCDIVPNLLRKVVGIISQSPSPDGEATSGI